MEHMMYSDAAIRLKTITCSQAKKIYFVPKIIVAAKLGMKDYFRKLWEIEIFVGFKNFTSYFKDIMSNKRNFENFEHAVPHRRKRWQNNFG